MKTILYYTKETFRYISITILILICFPALFIGLGEILPTDYEKGLFTIVVMVCIAIYGSEIKEKKDAEDKKSKRWNDIENGIHKHYVDQHNRKELLLNPEKTKNDKSGILWFKEKNPSESKTKQPSSELSKNDNLIEEAVPDWDGLVM